MVLTYQYDTILACSSRLYHTDDRRRNDGWETASKIPSRTRRAQRILKLNPKTFMVMVTPHKKMFAAKYFSMGIFCTMRLVGYSAKRIPK
jgi:hypothetical protein